MSKARVLETECEHAGLDPRKVMAIARRLAAASECAKDMGLTVFGGSGNGSLRFNDGHQRPLVVAYCGQNFDGGDGACNDDTGLMRGE